MDTLPDLPAALVDMNETMPKTPIAARVSASTASNTNSLATKRSILFHRAPTEERAQAVEESGGNGEAATVADKE
jgi:hypothetical protein